MIGTEEVNKATRTLLKYKAGKASIERRVIEAERWWKLKNWQEIHKKGISEDGNPLEPSGGWLHNAIVNKHADAVQAYPEANILAREKNDKAEAKKLTSIVSCVLEMNRFRETYSKVSLQKIKTGTGIYKVIWDAEKLNGLGDISIEKVDILNIFWEPGITDIQKSRNIFHVEMMPLETAKEMWPEIDITKSNTITLAEFPLDDNVDTSDMVLVVDWYYKRKTQEGVKLHYCKYVGESIIYSSENDTEMPTRTVTDVIGGQIQQREIPAGRSVAMKGWYEHGKYPFVFDPLYTVEGSPTGYGIIDVGMNAQTQIDVLSKALVNNAVASSTARFFVRTDGSVNEKEFTDFTKPIIHVKGNLGEDSIRQVDMASLPSNCINLLQNKIEELKEATGNRDTNNGGTVSGVTAASAIAALQEQAGKGSRASTLSSYSAFERIIELVIELIREFYTMPRSFRITGIDGQEEYTSYSNEGLQPQYQGSMFGMDMGMRLPVFDVKVSAQKQNAYSKVSQNELALQFFQLGFFNPQLTDQALMCLEIMDFDGKVNVSQMIQKNGTIYDKLIKYQQLALLLAQRYEPQLAAGLMQDMGAAPIPIGRETEPTGNNEENTIISKARERAQQSSQPE